MSPLGGGVGDSEGRAQRELSENVPRLSGRGPWAPSLSIATSVWDSLIHLPRCICLQAIGTFNNSNEAECVALSPHKAGSKGVCP